METEKWPKSADSPLFRNSVACQKSCITVKDFEEYPLKLMKELQVASIREEI